MTATTVAAATIPFYFFLFLALVSLVLCSLRSRLMPFNVHPAVEGSAAGGAEHSALSFGDSVLAGSTEHRFVVSGVGGAFLLVRRRAPFRGVIDGVVVFRMSDHNAF